MIVCHCTGATDGSIAQVIVEGARSVAEIARRTGAGRCCAPCREEIAVLLEQHAGAASRPRPSNTDREQLCSATQE